MYLAGAMTPMPTALAAILEGEQSRFRTIFYAHEVAPMRRVVEGNPGHDTMFYNVMRTAIPQACGERIITPSSTACPPTRVSSPLSKAGSS